MIETIEKTYSWLDRPPVSGHPSMLKDRAIVEFIDDVTIQLGTDFERNLFSRIADLMMHGSYYPDEIITFDGRFRQERRELKAGDRVLQLARLPFLFGYRTRTVTEISVAERTDCRCVIGYYTTTQHFAKGWWQATLLFDPNQGLTLNVRCQARPQSLLYWLAIPIARFMQERARRAAMSRFLSWV